MTTAFLLLSGCLLLAAGAESLVRGSSRIAAQAGISPLVVVVTIVAFGVSSAELAVSLFAAYTGRADISVGNVVGSNTFNVLMVLGASALITPLGIAQQLIRLDVPIMIGASLLLLLLAVDGRISRQDGELLLGLLLAYTIFRIRWSRDEDASVQAEYQQHFRPPSAAEPWWRNAWALVAIGITVLVLARLSLFGSNFS